MNKTLVFENTGEIESFKSTIKRGSESLPAIIAEYNLLKLQPLETPQHLQHLIDNTRSLVIDRLPISDDHKIFGFPVSREKAFTMLDIDLKPLERVINESDKHTLYKFIHVCKATKKGFEVDPERLSEVCEQYRVYASTPAEIEVYKAITAIQANYNTLQKAGMKVRDLGSLFNQSTYESNAPAMINPAIYRKLAAQANMISA